MESNGVFLTFQAAVTDGFRLEAIDYLLKPSVAEQVTEAANRLLSYLRLLGSGSSSSSDDRANEVSTPDKMLFTSQTATRCRSRKLTVTRSLLDGVREKVCDLLVSTVVLKSRLCDSGGQRSARISVGTALDLFELDSPVWSKITATGTKNFGFLNVGVYYRETIRRRGAAASARLKKSTFNTI